MPRRLVLISSLILTGCVRFGFDQAQGSARDAGVDDSIIGGGLNDPCGSADPCPSGLVCTGTGQSFICRPPCEDGGVCADGEACVRPVDGGAADSTLPMVCLPTTSAGRYEDCSAIPCEPGLQCGRGVTFAVCIEPCVHTSECEPGEDCIDAVGLSTRICLARCTQDDQCPGSFYCLGFAPDTTASYCMPDPPAAPGEDCRGRPCPPNMRCMGMHTGGPHACYPLCNDAACASSGQACAPQFDAYFRYCFERCDPFSQAPCGDNEICMPSLPVRDFICVPAQGSTGSCTDAPCASGLVCVSSKCEELCDDLHPCPGGQTCTSLSDGTTVAPWKACI